jgi:hypothetical protein
MHLVSCPRPQEPLEDAPRTALLKDLVEGERWDGFWSSQSDAYYVRCTRSQGDVEWFKLADEEVQSPAQPETRVLALRAKGATRSRVAVVVAQSPSGRRMLIGSARRTSTR